MNKLTIIVFVLACLCQIGFCLDYFTKNCCKAHDSVNLGFICDDGKYAPITGCCGVGSCNLACCNCDGGCKTGDYAGGDNPFGWPSGEIPVNGEFSVAGPPPAASDFIIETGKAVLDSAVEFGKAVRDDING